MLDYTTYDHKDQFQMTYKHIIHCSIKLLTKWHSCTYCVEHETLYLHYRAKIYAIIFQKYLYQISR